MVKTPFIKHRFKTKGKIIAIGDLHADYNALINTLIKANLIKHQKNGRFFWSGGNTYVVQIGDQIDGKTRSDINFDSSDELRIIRLLNFLDKKAKKHGGRVFSLLGNHEIMNCMGNFDYASNKNINSFGGAKSRFNAFKSGGWLARELANTRYSVLIINDILFVHGGISLKTLNKFDSLSEMNFLISEYLRGNLKIHQNNRLDYLLNDQEGIFWDRSLGTGYVNVSQVKSILNKYKVKKICIGHTVQNRINSVANGSVIRIDVGLSRAFGDNPIQFATF